MHQRKYLSAAHSEIHREGEALIDQYPSQRKPSTPTQQVKSRCNGLFTLHGTGTGGVTGNGTDTIGNNGSWSLSMSRTSVNISA